MPPSGAEANDSQFLVRMPASLRAELARHAEHEEREEGEDVSDSKIVRRALREYFRRHPLPKGSA